MQWVRNSWTEGEKLGDDGSLKRYIKEVGMIDLAILQENRNEYLDCRVFFRRSILKLAIEFSLSGKTSISVN